MPPVLSVPPGDSLAEQIQRAAPGRAGGEDAQHDERRRDGPPGAGCRASTTSSWPATTRRPRTAVVGLLGDLGWPAAAVVDLGGLVAARGLESYVLFWVAVRMATGHNQFNCRTIAQAIAGSAPGVVDQPAVDHPGRRRRRVRRQPAVGMRCRTGTSCSSTAASATSRRWHRHHTASLHSTAVRRRAASASTPPAPPGTARSASRPRSPEHRLPPAHVGRVRRRLAGSRRGPAPTGSRCRRPAATAPARPGPRAGAAGCPARSGRRPPARTPAPVSSAVSSSCDAVPCPTVSSVTGR